MAVVAQMPEQVRVAIVDSTPLFRDGVSYLISSLSNYLVVGEGETSIDAIQIAVAKSPDILLLDLAVDGGGINALATIGPRALDTKTIILTTNEDEEELATAFGAGARGFVDKRIAGSELIDVMATVQEGSTYASPKIASRYFQSKVDKENKLRDPVKSLTNRELDVLDGVAKGKTNKEIALSYKITEKTVKHYMTSILQKLQVRNRVEAALVARKYRTQP